jgi:glycine/D-amino acid oxidase-like deaminating enzyme
MPGLTNDDYAFTIIGAGILGTAIAALAAMAGYQPLVLRLPDDDRPNADTLRNQGWLQSGIMYSLDEFSDHDDYAVLANRTFFAGRSMLAECGIPHSTEFGIISVKDSERIRQLELKRTLLGMPNEDFRLLERSEFPAGLTDVTASDSAYYRIPDCPFDEAAVLRALRDIARSHNADFVQLTHPVQLEAAGAATRIRYGGHVFESPVIVIAAGAGSFHLVNQIGGQLDGELRRTPLLVSHSPQLVPCSVFVDWDSGYSAVKHAAPGLPNGAAVVGTKARLQPAPIVSAADRRIPENERLKFERCLHPALAKSLLPGRFTAGYEVIPRRTTGLTAYDPWIVPFGNVLFASPGRATIGWLAAQEALEKTIEMIEAASFRRVVHSPDPLLTWQHPIHMHYTTQYSFNDLEVRV